MQFRIKSLMTLVVCAAILAAAWRLYPLGRSYLIASVVLNILFASMFWTFRRKPAEGGTVRRALARREVVILTLAGVSILAFLLLLIEFTLTPPVPFVPPVRLPMPAPRILIPAPPPPVPGPIPAGGNPVMPGSA